MVKRTSNIPRGRKPKEFSRLAQYFKVISTNQICNPKPFSDDKSRCFVRKLLKEKIFNNDLIFIAKKLEDEQASLLPQKMTSNNRADFVISLLQKSGSLVSQIKKKFLDRVNWLDQLEKWLKIRYCGNELKEQALTKLLDCICGYIGPKNEEDDGEFLSEIQGQIEADLIPLRRGRADLFPVQDLGPIDELDPGSCFRDERENNRNNDFTSSYHEVDEIMDRSMIWPNEENEIELSTMQTEDLETRRSTGSI